MDHILVRGARTHNLKNLNVEIPRNKLVVMTGLSGSGKSSLAFDTLYAEGQRRYVESLSTYARQFLQTTEKPDVDHIEGLSPAISIDQKTAPRNPRSTVGTVTEIYDYLRLLFAKIGHPHCPTCGKKVSRQSASSITEHIAQLPEGKRILLLAPMVRGKKGEHLAIIERIKKEGFVRMRIDGQVMTIAEEITLDPNKKHDIEIVVDRLVVKNFEKTYTELPSGDKVEKPNAERTRLSDSVETALRFGEGSILVVDNDTGETEAYSEHFACPDHPNNSFPEIEPSMFSFNSPKGACETCHGLGSKLEIDPILVVPNPALTLDEGTIHPWQHTSNQMSWSGSILAAMAVVEKIPMNIPWSDLTEEQQHKVLYGTGRKKYKVELNGGSMKGTYDTIYEGVIPNLERRYRESESELMQRKIERYMRTRDCAACNGKRLRPEVLAITIGGVSIIDVTMKSIVDLLEFFGSMNLAENEQKIATMILKEVKDRLTFLRDVGLPYLTLERRASTLSGGEAQRIRLATQIGSKLQGVLYVLDEPSIGLHQKDNDRLIHTLLELRDLGNTVVVVEHDEDTMNASDWIIDIGPGAGSLGGHVVAEGTPEEIKSHEASITGKYLSGALSIPVPDQRRPVDPEKQLVIHSAHLHNLQSITASIPLGVLVAITGVSGSGKSTLINDILVAHLAGELNRAQSFAVGFEKITGVEHLDKLINIDQSPIGRTPRSNPATYTGVFTDIRMLFAKTNEARMRGYEAGRFSFNVKGGRCEACQGDGVKKIEMHFLPDIYVTCEVCNGKRYNQEALEITYRGKTIADVLDMTVQEAWEFFTAIPAIENKLATLVDVGLGYIRLGQSATTLSGGEAQRIKLATELSKRSTGQTMYILDEPTTGLHFEDVKRLLEVLSRLVDKGNTVLLIEHNMDMIKSADWIIDLGPDGGTGGGEIVAEGTPEAITKVAKSYTGQWLKKML